MKLFRRKTDYTYYSAYKTKRRRYRLNTENLLITVGVIAIIAIIAFLNLTRMKLMIKGYSFGQASDILSLTREEEQMILDQDKLDDISTWIDLSTEVKYYDEYQTYCKIKPKMKKKEVVSFIDKVFDQQVPKLKDLDYSNKTIWSILKKASYEDVVYLAQSGLHEDQIKEFLTYDHCIIQNMEAYVNAYQTSKSYSYALNIVNYPFILSTNDVTTTYLIQDPENILELVKPGFELSEDYEPDDLIKSDLGLTPECEEPLMRKEAAKALNEMAEDAKKEGYILLVNSAYRSYEDQTKVYQDTEATYGGQYAADYVAKPGVSEHQTGLGIDLKCQSAIETGAKFGDTADGKWVRDNCYKYGFIMRFVDGTSDITGISHEPWHIRYVGKKAAKKIHEKGYTFEEYCLYENVIPLLKEKES